MDNKYMKRTPILLFTWEMQNKTTGGPLYTYLFMVIKKIITMLMRSRESETFTHHW
jgi:hypothetical protein